MSHVTTIDLEVLDLSALTAACRRLGLELVRDQNHYRWYGRSVGHAPLPQGFNAEDLGQCDHAIRVRDLKEGVNHSDVYEIGVARRRDGRNGYVLLYDAWNDGCGMGRYVKDAQCSALKQAYALVVASRQAQRQGFQVQELARQDGSIQLQLSKA
jgi:hypothetical protein